MFLLKTVKKLRVQIALHYFLASTLILLLMGLILYYSISSLVLNEADSKTKAAVSKSGMYIELYIDRLKAVSSILAENPQLSTYVVHDLNRNPALPFEDGDFDAVICTVSVQYLIQPVEVFAEVNRILKPGGVFVLTFSNRCFPNKAVSVWLSTTDQQHIELVTQYFEESGNWRGMNSAQKFAKPPEKGDPLYAVWALKMSDG